MILPAAQTLEPAKQGSLDALCGIYSVINAIALTAYPQVKLGLRRQQDLFDYAIKVCRRTRSVTRLLSKGMSNQAWRELCGHLVKRANQKFGTNIRHRQLFSKRGALLPGKAIAAIKTQIDSGFPALIVLAGTYNHFTVVAGYRDRRMSLFDSGPHRWIDTRSCGTANCRPDARHRLVKSGGIALFQPSARSKPGISQ